MHNRQTHHVGIRRAQGLILAAAVAVGAAHSTGCSAANGAVAATKGCDGLDVNVTAQATVKAWADAVNDVQVAANDLQNKWLAVCNAMNHDLQLDTSKTNAADACAVLEKYINDDVARGITITVQPTSDCHADLSVQANCEASCKANVNCDVNANCTGGEVVVACNGQCSGQCDVTQPSFACQGTCKGECTASAAVQCSGECTGTCDAPSWNGTCDAGCTAMFKGSCGGQCTGMCDSNPASGTTCSGTCMGTCSAKATGSCSAQCTGTFTGGTCTGMCTGKCNASAGAMCSGTCNGTCSYMPGSAMCSGECHGMCTAAVSPPTCTGMLNCTGSAECHSDCQAQASAKVTCAPPQVTVAISGDDALLAAYLAHVEDIGTAVNLTVALQNPVAALASKSADTFNKLGDIGLAGASCVASELQVAGSLKVSITVSVNASAELTTGHPAS